MRDTGDQKARSMYITAKPAAQHVQGHIIQANTTRPPNAGSMLAHRLRRWPDIKKTLGERLVYIRGAVGRLSVTSELVGSFLYREWRGVCPTLGCVYAVTITSMSILLLREGNFQVLVILKWEMDYGDFCFLPNKCYHVIPSSCSKVLINFKTEIS